MADKADGSVVLARLQVAFLWECPVFSFNLSIVFGSFWLASLFLQVSSLVTTIDNPGLRIPTLLAKKFSCCVSYRLIEVSDHGIQISIFIYQRSKRCGSTTYSCLESTPHCGVIQLFDVKPYSWLGWFP